MVRSRQAPTRRRGETLWWKLDDLGDGIQVNKIKSHMSAKQAANLPGKLRAIRDGNEAADSWAEE